MSLPTEKMLPQIRIAIKGAGEMASGVAVRLYRAGFRRIVLLEVPQPMAVRREVSFCEAVYDGSKEVEDIRAVLVDTVPAVESAWSEGQVAVAVDPEWRLLPLINPAVSVDAILAKINLGTNKTEAPVVIALGPGFTAGVDAHYVVESNRGHDLGRVMTSGAAEPNTGVPGTIGGYTIERVLRAPVDGTVGDCLSIGEMVKAGQTVCTVDGVPVPAKIDGVLRGIIRPGIRVNEGLKLGDVDPRGRREYCFTVSEKARALGGSVLEAICAELFAGS